MAENRNLRLPDFLARLPTTTVARVLALVPFLIGPPLLSIGLVGYLRLKATLPMAEKQNLDISTVIALFNIIISAYIISKVSYSPIDMIYYLKSIIKGIIDTGPMETGVRQV